MVHMSRENPEKSRFKLQITNLCEFTGKVRKDWKIGFKKINREK